VGEDLKGFKRNDRILLGFFDSLLLNSDVLSRVKDGPDIDPGIVGFCGRYSATFAGSNS
jgi:hypothetical protein